MAYIRRKAAKHLLVGYRDSGGHERFFRCPDEATFERFQVYLKTCQEVGVQIGDPALTFGVPETKAKVPQTKQRRVATQTPSAPAPTSPTLAQWFGLPSKGEPGPFFARHNHIADGRRRTMERSVHRHAAALKDRQMHTVTVEDAHRLMAQLVACPACASRAKAANRVDVLSDPRRLSAAEVPWDGPSSCRREDGTSSHYPQLQRVTMATILGDLNRIWKHAVEIGAEPQSALAAVKINPIAKLTIPRFRDRPDSNDDLQALGHAQLQLLEASMPAEFAASIPVGAYGLLRRSELLGLERQMITWPTTPDMRGQAVLQISSVWCKEPTGEPYLKPFGKTEGSTREPVYLTSLATEALRAHFDRFRSTPDPIRCGACADGLLEHVGPATTNPHTQCDFANNAAVWVRPTGERPSPDSYFRMVAKAAKNAGLTKEKLGFAVSVQVLRITGATLLLEAGVELETVRRMGRWSNTAVLQRHYHRQRDAARANAAAALDVNARLERGLTSVGADERSIGLLVSENAHLRDRVQQLEAALTAAGKNPADVGVPARLTGKRPTAFTDEAVIAAVSAGGSRKAMLERLGVGLAKKNYARLAARAAELGLELPDKWGSATGNAA